MRIQRRQPAQATGRKAEAPSKRTGAHEAPSSGQISGVRGRQPAPPDGGEGTAPGARGEVSQRRRKSQYSEVRVH
eukprot:2698809-Pyramimonas_sp.AAC.1